MKQIRLVGSLCLLLLLALPIGCTKGGAARTVTGQVVVSREGKTLPVAEAQVRLWPQDPGAKGELFEYEAVQNLRGVTLTRASGQFEVGMLTSAETHAEYPLLKGWSYVIEVEVPGYYITQAEFEYNGGQAWVEVAIDEKPVDVLDTSGGVKDNDKELHRGAIRRE